MTTTNQFSATIRIGILVYEGFEPIDVWGFTEAFAISRFIGTDYQSPPPYPFEILFISNEVRPSGKLKAVPAPIKSSFLMANQQRLITRRSRGWRSSGRAFCGTTSRVGSMPDVM